MSEHEQQYPRPLPTGTRLIYYNKAQCRALEAMVLDAGLVILFILDQQKSETDQHYIAYQDIVRIIQYPLSDREIDYFQRTSW